MDKTPELAEFVQVMPGTWDKATEQWVMEQAPWNSDDADMPPDLWYRALSVSERKPVDQVRSERQNQESPRRVPLKTPPRPPRDAVEAPPKVDREALLRELHG